MLLRQPHECIDALPALRANIPPGLRLIAGISAARIVLNRLASWPNTSLMKTIGYDHVSTDKQADRGVSLEAQAENIRAMAMVHNAELIEIISTKASPPRA